MNKGKKYSPSSTFYLLHTFSRTDWTFTVDAGEGHAFMKIYDSRMWNRHKNFGTAQDPSQVEVLFWPHRIVYWFSKCCYRVKDKCTVRFINQLMNWMNVPWMNMVLSSLNYDIVDSIMDLAKHTLCINQSKYNECESMFRRMVTPALTICKEMMDKGRMMSRKEMKRYFISEVLPDIVDFGDIANDDGETIYIYVNGEKNEKKT